MDKGTTEPTTEHGPDTHKGEPADAATPDAQNAHDGKGASDLPAYRTAVLRRMLDVSLAWQHPVSSTEALLDPVAIVGSLWLLLLGAGLTNEAHWWAVTFLLVLLTFPSPAYLRVSVPAMLRSILASWIVLVTALVGGSLAIGAIAGLPPLFEFGILKVWLWLAPLTQIVLHLALRVIGPILADLDGGARVAVIAGASDCGCRLALQLLDNPYGATRVAGFFDDRQGDRLPGTQDLPLLGPLMELPAYVAANKANVVYITLPLAAQSRIVAMLDALRHTRARVYFAPDNLVADLFRGSRDAIGNLPVVALLDSPFAGVGGLLKRLFDIVFASVLAILALPLMLPLAVATRLFSAGPMFVTQRRYGLDGREIHLYAIRATKPGAQENALGDKTPPLNAYGRFLRNSQLEKLPRLINVIQGRLSLVGPRPHAKTHNEIYRRIVKGHLIRHQVRCGITGWAQINGVRGGTKALDHMKARVSHDLEYLRHWSVRLDLQIMLRSLADLFARRH